MNRLVVSRPTFFGGDTLADFCLSNLFYDPVQKERTEWLNETDDTIELEIDVPGFEKSDIAIEYKDDILSIKAKHEENDRHNRHIERRFNVPAIDISKSSAEVQNGVLKLRLEKQAKAKSQTLKIK